MSTSLLDVWEASAANPYYPAVPKERQFLVGATLLVLGRLNLEASSIGRANRSTGLMLSSAFALSTLFTLFMLIKDVLTYT